MAARLRAALSAVRRREGASIVELLQTPEQRVVLDRLQAIMTLLEGHADQVMDAVGPVVVPSVKTIRERFERRRDGISPIDRVVRKLLGLDLKLQQYREGGAFVRAVVSRVGVGGFNTVWESPQTLPTRAELAAPEAWLTRVLGLTPGRLTHAMAGPPPAVAAVRLAVRHALQDLPGLARARGRLRRPDSTALAAAVAFEAPRLGLPPASPAPITVER